MVVEPVSAHFSTVTEAARQCAVCFGSLTGFNVVREGYGSIFHAENVRLGLNVNVNTSLSDVEGSVHYKCCSSYGGATRIKGVQTNDLGIVNQLLSIMENFASDVKKLIQTVTDLIKAQYPQNHFS